MPRWFRRQTRRGRHRYDRLQDGENLMRAIENSRENSVPEPRLHTTKLSSKRTRDETS